MASNPELVNLSEDDKRKLMRAQQEKKWSVEILGYDIPIWIIVVVIVIIVFVLHKQGYLSSVEQKAVEFSEGTRRMLDKVTKRKTTSTTSPFMSATSPAGAAAAAVTGAASEQVKAQLRQLFNSY
jgi:hypothetical protein